MGAAGAAGAATGGDAGSLGDVGAGEVTLAAAGCGGVAAGEVGALGAAGVTAEAGAAAGGTSGWVGAGVVTPCSVFFDTLSARPPADDALSPEGGEAIEAAAVMADFSLTQVTRPKRDALWKFPCSRIGDHATPLFSCMAYTFRRHFEPGLGGASFALSNEDQGIFASTT